MRVAALGYSCPLADAMFMRQTGLHVPLLAHSAMDMEVCTTLGMLSPEQAQQLKQAGLTAYNHNLDTSREFYPSVITTRKYDERLETIEAVRAAGLSVCSGGIVGLGEKDGDRVGLIYEMSQCVSLSGFRLRSPACGSRAAQWACSASR